MKFLQRWFQSDQPTEPPVLPSNRKGQFKLRAKKQLEDLLVNKPEKALKRRSYVRQSLHIDHQVKHKDVSTGTTGAHNWERNDIPSLRLPITSKPLLPLTTKPEKVLVRGKFSSKGELRDWNKQPELFEDTSVHSFHLSSEASSPTLAYDGEFSQTYSDDNKETRSINSSCFTFYDTFSIGSTDGMLNFTEPSGTEVDDHAESCEYCRHLARNHEVLVTEAVPNSAPNVATSVAKDTFKDAIVDMKATTRKDPAESRSQALLSLYIMRLLLAHKAQKRTAALKSLQVTNETSAVTPMNEYIMLAFS